MFTVAAIQPLLTVSCRCCRASVSSVPSFMLARRCACASRKLHPALTQALRCEVADTNSAGLQPFCTDSQGCATDLVPWHESFMHMAGSVTQCWRRDGRRLGDGPDTGSGARVVRLEKQLPLRTKLYLFDNAAYDMHSSIVRSMKSSATPSRPIASWTLLPRSSSILASSLIEGRQSCIDLIRRHPDLRLLHWYRVLQAHCKPHRAPTE